MEEKVERFQHLLIRLSSLLYCTALQQIAVLDDEAFEIIAIDGISEESLLYLAEAPEKCLVILQWIQRLIVQSAEEGIITAPPPVLSRVYQELSRGIVNIVNAQKITDILFPFPYAQFVSVMLMCSTVLTPWIMATIMDNLAWCAVLTFISVFSFHCINYIACEIEMPFGQDPNDLPVAKLQESFNTALIMLLDRRCTKCPDYEFDADHRLCKAVQCPYFLITETQHTTFLEGKTRRTQPLTVADGVEEVARRLSQLTPSRRISQRSGTSKVGGSLSEGSRTWDLPRMKEHQSERSNMSGQTLATICEVGKQQPLATDYEANYVPGDGSARIHDIRNDNCEHAGFIGSAQSRSTKLDGESCEQAGTTGNTHSRRVRSSGEDSCDRVVFASM